MRIKSVNTMTHNLKLSMSAAAIIALSGCGGSNTSTDIKAVDTSLPVSDWVMVWSDEFEGNSIDANKWTHEIDCAGGGNQEKQCYTDSAANSFVADGSLQIVAMPTDASSDLPLPYTSARMITKYKGDWTYGRFEMRAKLPEGQGTWPAFWMLPTDEVYGGWPKSGEIDILEAVNLKADKADGTPEDRIYGTLHYGLDFPDNESSGKDYTPPSNPADGFHTYSIEWQKGEVRWYMDGYLYATQLASELNINSEGTVLGLNHRGWFAEYFNIATGEKETQWNDAPFDQDFHLILNLAVGGDWPENVNETGIDETAFVGGQTFEIDYVRVYECSINPLTGAGCETVRGGYKDEDDALVEGKAPTPPPPPSTDPVPITIFSDEVNPGWPLWDSSNNTTPEVVADDEERGDVAEFKILDNDGAVLGFNSRIAADDVREPYNGSAMYENGFLSFDMKVVSAPTADPVWYIKLESDNNNSDADFVLSDSLEGMDPIVGEWQTYTFSMRSFADAELDLSLIDLIMIFPAWGSGEGAIYRVDNVKIESPDSGPMYAEFTEGFGGASIDGKTYSFLSGSEVWGGFANTNEAIYPLNFTHGGKLTFTASVPEGESDTSIRFVFENAPFPNVDPTFATENVLISGVQAKTYTVNIPPQDAENTYSSFLLYINDIDNSVNIQDVQIETNNQATMDPFGNTMLDSASSTYEFPSNAEVWGGFANTNEGLYPFNFSLGGKVTFTGSIPAGESDVTVNFRFERLPFPEVDPAFSTDNITVSGSTEETYTVYIPPQDAANTYSSFLLYLVDTDSPVVIKNITVTQNENVAMWEGFGGAMVDEDSGEFDFPSGSEVWGGFANNNADVYPYNFEAGGRVEFTAALPAGGANTNVRFLFEKNPFPDVTPSFGTDTLTVTDSTLTRYVIEIPPQPAENTYSSFLLYLDENDSPVIIKDVVVTADRVQQEGN